VLGICLAAGVTSANAGTLTGQDGTLYYDYPSLGSAFSTDPFTVPATVITLTYGPDLVNDIGGSSIDITFGNVGYSFAGASFNGEDFNFPGTTITVTGYSSNFTGDWGAGPHDVWVNWQGLTPDSSSYVTIDVAAAPEPASMALLGVGLAGLGLIRRKRA